MRDAVVDFVTELAQKTELPAQRLSSWLGVARGKYFDWKRRYGKVNEHNATVPRDHWLTAVEIGCILRYYEAHPLEGYRRLTYMMMDEDIVAVSPSSVYRVLCKAGLLDRWNGKPSKKGTGFEQPLQAHEHWHIDISYLNLGGTFYYLCTILDGYSRYIVHFEIREAMKEVDVETILQPRWPPQTPPAVAGSNSPSGVAGRLVIYAV